MTNNKSSFIIKLEGFIFSLTHYLIVMVSFMLGMFTKDWLTLGVITFNMLVILALNIYMQDCPLTIIENDKLGTGITNIFMNMYFRKDKINKKSKTSTTYQINIHSNNSRKESLSSQSSGSDINI